ncbi:MAG: prolipoprotein diacylglyceryl transferase, partial [Ruminococcus sp.]|nr:prolipoprotein diacylglyceryl transferase [Candidatus Copronaster equi]
MDTVTVYFNGIKRGFEVSSILADFSVFGHHFTIHWYGAIIAFGFLLAVLFGGRMAYKWKMSIDKMLDVLIYGTIFGIIGARLYYCIFKWDLYKDNPIDLVKIWEGGLAIYGGIIGGLAAAFIVCKARKMNFWNLLDMASMSLLIGQGIGRWGNFANQEAFGTNTDLPWGMWSTKTASYIMDNMAELQQNGIVMDPNKAVHPTFLYESISCLLGFVVLYIITRKARKFSGQIFLCYGVWYGIERAVVEGFRTDSLY